MPTPPRPAPPRTRAVEGPRHGNRAERRTLELSQEVVPYLAAPPAAAQERYPAGQSGQGGWLGLTHVAHVRREVESVSGPRAGQTTREEASALVRWVSPPGTPPTPATPARVLAAWQGHWQIENGLHYRRDVTCGEDACTVRCGAAPATCAPIRNTALARVEPLLRQERFPNLPAAQRRFAMYPAAALALLGITAPQLE